MKINSFLSMMLACTLITPRVWSQTKKANPDLAIQLKKSDENLNAFRIDLSQKNGNADFKKTNPAHKKDDKNQPNTKEMGSALASILDSIKSLRANTNINFTFVEREKDSKIEKFLDINKLKLIVLAQFKKDIILSTLNSDSNSQAQKLIPSLNINTNNMWVVSKAIVENKSQFSIKFCYNYTYANDFCNTLDDQKLLEFTIHSQMFNTIINIRLKEIKINIEKKLVGTDDVYQASGVCTAFQKAINEDVNTIYSPMDCAFTAIYSPNPKIGTKVDFKFEDKL